MIAPKKLYEQLVNPRKFFDDVRSEGWRPCFIFFLWVTLAVSLVTSVLNFFGMESTDMSSSYQAQIVAYNFAKSNLVGVYGVYAYAIEPFLILVFSILILAFLTLLLHVVFRLAGGEGPLLNAWKAACYGVGPCLLGGFLPYVSLFAGFYSFAMQFYLGPMTLYKAKEGRALAIFVAFIALAFIEMFTLGSTVSF